MLNINLKGITFTYSLENLPIGKSSLENNFNFHRYRGDNDELKRSPSANFIHSKSKIF